MSPHGEQVTREGGFRRMTGARRGCVTVERSSSRGLPFRLSTSTVRGATLRVVLVHGIGMSHRYMRRLHEALRLQATVVSVDMPGHGGVRRPDGDATVADMALALAEAVPAVPGVTTVWVGHSMGAQWVTELVGSSHPGRRAGRPADGIVLIGPVADARRRSPLAHAARLGSDMLRESPLANAIVLGDYVRCGIPWYVAQLRHMLVYPIEARLSAVPVPVLVLRGSRDPIAVTEWCRLLADRAPDGRLIEIGSHAHMVQHGAARAVADCIVEFARDAARSQ